MSRQTRIALVGASGLIGMSLIRLAVERTDVRIIAIARRELDLPRGARMEVLVADPENWADAIAAANAKVLVSALGTTWNKAGKDEESFRAVDQELVLACGRAAKAANMRQMIAISSVGADSSGKNFYLRVKGETEQQRHQQRCQHHLHAQRQARIGTGIRIDLQCPRRANAVRRSAQRKTALLHRQASDRMTVSSYKSVSTARCSAPTTVGG